ncbi:MAG: trigger factor [Bacteroidales bacterium]|nr:trigger factor [Candidatus Colimorpha pelethequi]
MNVTRESLSDLDLRIKVEVSENDYAEKVSKQLKNYRQKATVPGFRKGMAPMGLIQRMYKPSVVADEVQNVLGEALYKYIDDEKLEIIGSPLSNEEMTGTPDFEKGTDFTFYFDAALAPKVDIDWSKVDVKLAQIKITAKDVDKQIDSMTKRFGKFETPETIGENDFVYGKVVELDKNGAAKEGGVSTFTSFELPTIKDEEIRVQFIGKKAEEKVVINAGKAFTAADIEKNFHLDAAAAKKFKSDIEVSISGCSRITPHEMNEEFFEQVYPGEGIKDADKFRKAVQKDIEKANAEQCEILYVNQVRKALLDNFSAQMPEAFLKRWIASRGDKDVTPESVENEWVDKYVPSLKWELIDGALNKLSPIEPTNNEVVDYIKDILKKNDQPVEGETDKEKDDRIEKAARTIAADRQNVQQIIDKLYVEKTAKLFKEQLKPEVEKITVKEFEERCKA